MKKMVTTSLTFRPRHNGFNLSGKSSKNTWSFIINPRKLLPTYPGRGVGIFFEFEE